MLSFLSSLPIPVLCILDIEANSFTIQITKCMKLHFSISNMHKTGIGRELRNESFACRPCSLNFVDKLLREVLDFWKACILRLSCPICLLP